MLFKHVSQLPILLLEVFLAEPAALEVQAGDVSAEREKDSAARYFGLQMEALSEPLITDRPDFTESVETIPDGHWQVETGYTFTYNRVRSDRTRDHGAPELLGRVGLWKRLELRIGWSGYQWAHEKFLTETRVGRPVVRQEWSDGANDLELGFKCHLIEPSGWLPDFSIIGSASIPAGSGGVTSGDVDPTVKLLMSYDLSERVGLSGNVNFSWLTEDADRFLQTSASLSLGVSLTEKLGSYLEYFGFYPNHRDSGCAHYLNGGLTYLITNNLQFDIRAGTGLNEASDDFFAGVGFSWRI